jgi:4-amino-4-deoxy-L-arabinose transferase-like glycosyltransferase
VGVALLAGLALRLWFIAHFSRVAGDSLVYGNIARNLVLHWTYGLTEDGPVPRPTLIRVPGYPIFLAACFRLFGVDNFRAVFNIQAVADLLTCCLASATAGRLFGRRAVLPVLWIAALCPFTANYVATAITETLVLSFIALTFYSLVRWKQAGLGFNRWLWLLSAALGCGILLRPEQGLLPAAVVPAMLWMALGTKERRRKVIASALPVAVGAVCVLLPLVPWTARNWRIFHVIQPLAPSAAADPGEVIGFGFDHWVRSWAIDFISTAQIAWPYDDKVIDLANVPTRAFALGCSAPRGVPRESLPLYTHTASLFNDYNQETTASPALDARFAELANQRIKADPICYHAVMPVARLLNMVLRPRTELFYMPLDWWRWRDHRGQSAFAVAYAALNLAYLALACAGLAAWRRRGWLGTREIAWAMVASIILRCGVLLALDISEPRYTLEFFPVLFVMAGALFASADSLSRSTEANYP